MQIATQSNRGSLIAASSCIMLMLSRLYSCIFSWKCKRPGHLPEDCLVSMGIPAQSPADPTLYHVRMVLLSYHGVHYQRRLDSFVLSICFL